MSQQTTQRSWGYAAEFTTPAAITAAAKQVASAGYRWWDCHTPFPVHGLDTAMGVKPTILPIIVFFEAYVLEYIQQHGEGWKFFPELPRLCKGCGYDLQGHDTSGVCPECGRSKILIENLINNVIENEMVQTGDEAMLEDLRYKLGRLTRGRRIPRQLTSEHGLVQGLERGLIGQEVIRPWLTDEFVNCLGFFLMTRKPKYWRNGTAGILLVQPYSDELVESLKEV